MSAARQIGRDQDSRLKTENHDQGQDNRQDKPKPRHAQLAGFLLCLLLLRPLLRPTHSESHPRFVSSSVWSESSPDDPPLPSFTRFAGRSAFHCVGALRFLLVEDADEDNDPAAAAATARPFFFFATPLFLVLVAEAELPPPLLLLDEDAVSVVSPR